ncbi:hypothetical protein AVL56_00390 [Alteromonas stellipolaris]|uniref:retron Ec78 anti-phage system effector ATPase PtuA n=1 Tax=Alteromonas stellipolaris TaxID=233316 RepID=UPI00076FF0E6|nr:retron Ec78 anti-phage system effector ATPase PtuA [Alteromonas stellipolaris]AMJ92912.1 hypothetical protein AVL56_00390 [Alteromonas stellipolaris]MDP2596621.1 retron Ec78 anti-phage system effector ATPase PtuA [Alteromonas stellipolaris]
MNEKNLRNLKNRAHKGDILAKFELYNLFVDEDKVKAEKLKKELIEHLNSNGIRLEDIQLYSFRKFETLRIESGFDKNLTVLIGLNGDGKTSILEAISKTLSWLTANIVKEQGQGSPVNYSDIKNNSILFSDIASEFSSNSKYRYQARLSRAVKGSGKKRDSDVINLRKIADIWRTFSNEDDVCFPIFASYLVERSYPLSVEKRAGRKERMQWHDAYSNCLEGSGKFESFIDWFISTSKIANSSSSESIDKTENIKPIIEKLAFLADNKSNLSVDEYEKLKEVLSKFESKADVSVDSNSASIELSVLKRAISSVIPSVTDIWLSNSEGKDDIMVNIDSKVVNLNQLSDGQRTLLALICDLARRLMLLNKNRKNPLHGNGIVLIDEIELHLHPTWQQSIIPLLTKTFPNIQFVIATHSPQVLTTVDKKNIRQFDETNSDDEFWLAIPEFQSESSENNIVLEQLMNTPSAPETKTLELLKDVTYLVEAGLFGASDEHMHKLKNLESHFGDSHPNILRLKDSIKLMTLKKRIAERKQSKEE